MKHNSILAYKLRREDVQAWLRKEFNDQSIVVEVSELKVTTIPFMPEAHMRNRDQEMNTSSICLKC